MLEAAETLASCKQLSIFGLGRALKRKAHVKHNIKTIDRMFGNSTLATQGHVYYEDCIRWLVGNNKRPLILVDWSGLTRCGEFHFLRASVPVGGRALPIMDMVFRLKDYGSDRAHKLFLNQLKNSLPADCKPIIVTDAGFRCPWFKLVKSLDWDFVGSVRHQTLYRASDNQAWNKVKSLYQHAQTKAKSMLEPGCNEEHIPSICLMGEFWHKSMINLGDTCTQEEHERAFNRDQQLFEQAHQQGYADASYLLGQIYQNNDPPDLKKAKQYYQKAANQIHIQALYDLAMILNCNQETMEQAHEYFLRAATLGNVYAMNELASSYEQKARLAATLEEQDIVAALMDEKRQH